MKNIYHVKGMHCSSCVGVIKKALLALPHITDVKVDLATHVANIKMSEPISLAELNDALKETTYQLTDEEALPLESSSAPKKKIKDFLPLIIAFVIIIAYTAIMLLINGSWDNLYAMRHFEGAFFVIFGLLKLLNWKGFVDAYRTYDIVAKRSQVYAYIYPLIELALGLAYLTGFQLLLTSMFTFIIMAIGTIGVSQALINKKQIPCACMGAVFKIPMTIVTLIEDLMMGVMALIMMIIV